MKLNESYVERLKELDNPKFKSYIQEYDRNLGLYINDSSTCFNDDEKH